MLKWLLKTLSTQADNLSKCWNTKHSLLDPYEGNVSKKKRKKFLGCNNNFQIFFNAGSDKKQYYRTDLFLSFDAAYQIIMPIMKI